MFFEFRTDLVMFGGCQTVVSGLSQPIHNLNTAQTQLKSQQLVNDRKRGKA